MTFLDAAQSEISHVTLEGRNTNDRWELVADRVMMPVGTRFLRYRFTATRGSTAGNDAYLDGAFVYVLPNAVAPDLGAYGNTEAEGGESVPQHLAPRSPDLYRGNGT